MKKFWNASLIVMVFLAFFMGACNYNYIVIPETPPVDTTVTYSFADDVYSIFPDSECTNCHPNSAGLDLSEANAYSSIMDNNLVDLADPENSKIWEYPHPSRGTHLKKYSATDERVSIMLEWIKQGAKDN